MSVKNNKVLIRSSGQKESRGFPEVNGIKTLKVSSRSIMEKLVKCSLGVTGAGALFLMSNMDLGTVGSWARFVLAGIACYWLVLIAYIKWMERDTLRRNKRQLHRLEEKILDSENRSFFLRETLAA